MTDGIYISILLDEGSIQVSFLGADGTVFDLEMPPATFFGIANQMKDACRQYAAAYNTHLPEDFWQVNEAFN